MRFGTSSTTTYKLKTTHSPLRGVTLIDTLVGVGLMVVVFVGIAGVFMLSIDVVTNNKARIGALALANEQMEYLRSLAYDDVGTAGGIPSGNVAQSEEVDLNGVLYTRSTFIEYVDLPQDGTAGADSNGVITDAKQAEVSVSWTSRGQSRSLSLVSLFTPPGVESLVPGGTISIFVEDAAGAPIQGASVRVVNAAAVPAVDVTTVTNVSGQMVLLGAPAAAGYEITVTRSGYSTEQTYSATGELTNPSPGHLTVSLNQTTQATFAIDVLSSFTVRTFREITEGAWSDSFSNENNVSSTTNIVIAGGGAALSDLEAAAGSLISTTIQHQYLYRWGEFSWSEATAEGNTIRYQVYADGVPVSDAALPGNAAGFTTSPVDLSSLSTTTYPVLQLRADLTGDGESTPELLSWQVSYEYGPEPLPNIEYALVGTKTIGTTGGGNPVYKYDETGDTGAGASVTLPTMEWDTYTLTVPSSTGYDIAASCTPQPNTLAPGVALTTTLYFAPDTAHSLLVDVRDDNGELLEGAVVELSRGVYEETVSSDTCGNAFFRGLSSGTLGGGNPYTLTVTAAGYQVHTDAAVDVSGVSGISVILVP